MKVVDCLLAVNASVCSRNAVRAPQCARARSPAQTLNSHCTSSQMGSTPLHVACSTPFSLRHHAVAARLAEVAATAGVLNATDGGGFTPLLLAVRAGDLDMVQLLLRAGASPDTARQGEWEQSTPLQWAQAARRWDISIALLSRGSWTLLLPLLGSGCSGRTAEAATHREAPEDSQSSVSSAHAKPSACSAASAFLCLGSSGTYSQACAPQHSVSLRHWGRQKLLRDAHAVQRQGSCPVAAAARLLQRLPRDLALHICEYIL